MFKIQKKLEDQVILFEKNLKDAKEAEREHCAKVIEDIQKVRNEIQKTVFV